MRRSYDKEMMDLTGNSRELLAEDLRNLRMMNRHLGGSRSVMRAWQWMLTREPRTHMSVLDVGTGSADIPAALSAWAKRRNVTIKIVGLEMDPITASIAAAQTKQLVDIEIIQGDAGAPPFLPGSFDWVVASQFLHHFSEARIVSLLRQWAKLARLGIVISDLVRHPVAYHGIRLLTKLTTRNVMTLIDAPLSVRRALTFKEWRGLLCQADIGSVKTFSVFPFRVAAVVQIGSRR